MKIRISKRALADVDNIFRQTRGRWGEAQAERYVSAIWEAFEEIVADPKRWRVRDHIHPGCQIYFCGRHAILYRIRIERVEIARVLHDAMDFKWHIPPGFIEESENGS